MTEENERAEPYDSLLDRRPQISIYRIVEVGFLGVAFAIFYSFGILRFTQMVAMAWGRWPAFAFAMFGVAIAIAFIDAVSRLLNDTRKPRDDDKA